MKAQLRRIADQLLQEPEDTGLIWQACQDYREMLLACSSLDLDGPIERDNIQLSSGEALGTAWAARCIDDFLRTRRFIRGTFEAVREAARCKEGEPVHLLYAGTGPFASLVLPLICYFSPRELQFTFLEINPLSFQYLQRIIAAFELSPYLRSLALEDATQFTIPESLRVDIVLSETMQAGLRKEPQVAICRHLFSQQPAAKAQLIPESVNLSLGIYNTVVPETAMKEGKVVRPFRIGSYFALNREWIQETEDDSKDHKVSFSVARDWIKHGPQLAIFTEIGIFGNHRLELNQSGLTIPLIIRDLSHHPIVESKIRIRYELSAQPGEVIQYTNQ